MPPFLSGVYARRKPMGHRSSPLLLPSWYDQGVAACLLRV